MDRKETIQALSIALGEYECVIRLLVEAIEHFCDNSGKINPVFRQIKALAKQKSSPRRKSYESPYAKFDRLKKKRR